MFNQFFKTFFFTSIAVAALVGLLVSLDATSDWFANILASLIRPYYREISTVTVALFPIATTVLCGLLTLIVNMAMHLIFKKDETVTKGKTSKFFIYYFISLVVVSLLVLLSSMLRFNLLSLCLWASDVFAIGLLYGACIVEAIALSALLVSFFTLWKTNRPVSYVLGVIILLIIPLNYISGEAIYEIADYSNYDDSDYGSGYSSESAEAEEVFEYSDDESGYEAIEVEEDYLSFLWDEDEDISSTFSYLFRNCLSDWNGEYPNYFLSDIDWLVDRLNENSEEWRKNFSEEDKSSEKILQKIHDYLTEDPSGILSTFYSYQNVIYQYMPVSDFYGTGAYALLSYLTVAHEDLYSDSDLNRLQKIYKLMVNIEHVDAVDYYEDLKIHINNDYLSNFNDKDGDLYQGGVVWAYSFWARRHAERTDDIAYTILSHLNEHYSEAEYYTSDEDSDEDYYYESEEDN